MPVNTLPLDSKLKLNLDGGFDEKGNIIVKSKTYSKIKPTATNEDVYEVASALTGLQTMPLLVVKRLDEVELTQPVL